MKGQTGIVFDLQRCSLHDGPGIRTTVFLKGCPLHCIWCHNPESISFAPQLSYNAEKCMECLACVEVCERGAQRAVDGGHAFDRDRCHACGACASACLFDALTLVGERMAVSEILAEVEKDRAYYERSGGGLTLSGGEPMAQFPFTLALLQRAKERGIHTCIETCGFAPQEQYAEILPWVDLFLFDCKATNPERHRELTGVSNGRILANLDILIEQGAAIILRCPLVPGVNDTSEHLKGIAQLVERYPQLERVELMAYHDLGIDKARRVGRDPALTGVGSAEQAVRERWLETLAEYGCEDVQIG